MKFTILFALLLSVSTFLGAKEMTTDDISAIAKKNAELREVKSKLAEQKAINAEHESTNLRQESKIAKQEEALLKNNQSMLISVTGQGVAPMNTTSPAQAYALAKRAAVADAYRAIAEKVKGVRIDGQDLIKNMMVKRSIVRTSVQAMVRNANVVETTFKEGLCEVEMEIVILHSDFAQ